MNVRPRFSAVTWILFTLLLTHSPQIAAQDHFIPCFANIECPDSMRCNWGLCEDALAPSSGRLFQFSVYTIFDRTSSGLDSLNLRQSLQQRLVRALDTSGYFSSIAEVGSYPVTLGTLFETARRGSAYAVLAELMEFDGERGALRIRVFDAEMGEPLPDIETFIEFPLSTSSEVLAQWVNGTIERFSGRPGIVGAGISCVKKLAPGVKEVFTMEFGSGFPQPLTFDRSLALLPTWTPDGKVAYTSFRDGYPRLFVDGRPDPVAAYDGMNSGAEWSPDGRTIALTLSKDGGPDVYLLDGESGKVVRRLTQNQSVDTSPSFSPDGQRIVFVSDRDGTPQLFLMSTEGSEPTRLTRSGSYNSAPDWHPFGPYVIYNGRYGGSFQVFRIDVTTGETTQLTWGPGDCESPSWSPDGRLILFAWQKRDGSKDLYVMASDGSNVRAITDDGGPYSSPEWARGMKGDK